MNKIVGYIKKNKKGALIGAAIGAGAAYLLKALNPTLLFSFDSQAVFDQMVGRAALATPEGTFIKLLTSSIILGALIGMYFDDKNILERH
jgi:hypothetical protein